MSIILTRVWQARERIPRESKLLQEYQKALAFLNQSLPERKKIFYKPYDMSREAKT
jgi:phosphatidylinositol 3,5-bisphosphate 5-phosphatase